MGRPKGSKNLMPGIRKTTWKAMPKATKIEKERKRQATLERLKVLHLAHEDALQMDTWSATERLSYELYHRFKSNPMIWAHYYFPNHLRLATPPFHLQMMRAVMNARFVAMAAPRESSKSTLLSFFYLCHGIVFQRFHFIIIVSNTFKKSAMALEGIKRELRDNQLLTASFRETIAITKDAEGDSEFRHPDGFLVKVLCKGVDQIGSIRGVKFGPYRPDLILGDDIEDDELVKNPERRQELEHLIDEALIPAGAKERCQYVFIGTILHDDSQLAKMVVQPGKYPEFLKVFFQAHLNPDLDGEESLWPEKWSLDDLRTLREDKPLVYAKEYQNNPVAAGAQKFHTEDFRYWKMEHGQYVLFDDSHRIIHTGALASCKAAIACDLAWEVKRQSDYSVIMPGFLTPQSDLLVYTYAFKKGMRPPEIEEIIFTLEDRLRKLTGSSVPIGFEKAKLEKVVRWLLQEAMRRRNHFLMLRDLRWDTDKIGRIETRLTTRYSMHSIYHLQGMGDLEHQLLRFPSGQFDDLPDALQGLVQLLQYPKRIREAIPEDDMFMRLRQHAINSRQVPRGLFRLNGSRHVPGLHVVTTPLE